MREIVSRVSGPIALVDYYPVWLDGLEDCQKLYKIDRHQAETLREAIGTEMATVLGEETAFYLHMQRLYKDHSPEHEWIDTWRVFAIVGVAGVQDILDEQKKP